jgi:hypothetical protein
MDIYSKNVPLAGIGLILAGIAWFFACIFIAPGSNPYFMALPAGGLFLTGFAVIGGWVGITLWTKNSN